MESTQFQISGHEMFTPSTEQIVTRPNSLRFGKEKVMKFRNNPTAKQKKESYWPRLTLNVSPARAGGGLCYRLRVEFSAPKVIYGNNFDEMIDIQFGDMLRSLCEKMRIMGITTTPEHLAQSGVSTIHYSKNIKLGDCTRCSMVLNELSKLNIWKRLDVNSKDFRNNGHVLKWHANSYEICVYDKVQDLQKARTSPKRAFEAEPDNQLALFEGLQKHQEQVLRLEVRLNTKRKIKGVLKALSEDEDVIFYHLFSKRIAAKVLNYFWAELMAEYSMASLLEVDLRNPELLVEAIKAEHPDLQPSKIFSLIGTTLLLQKVGECGLPVLFPDKSDKTIKRLIKDCKTYQPESVPRWTAVRQVKEQLTDFIPLRLEPCYNQQKGTL